MNIAPFGFATAGTIRFGRGVLAEAAPFAAQYRRVLLVRSASVAGADGLARDLRRSGDLLEVIAKGEPGLPAIEQHLVAARPFAPDLVIAIGGGAVIDLGKALAALIPAPHGALRYLEVVGEGRPLDRAPLPLIAIPTTAGTGTEVTRNAVIGVPDAARKVSLRDPRLYPTLALIDPDLCLSCPRAVVLASGLDAITQVIEPFISSRANPMTDALCRDAIPRGLSALQRLLDQGDTAAWDDMALTSVFGGLALANAGLGAVHGFAGVIGGQTGAAHGAICGTLLVPVLQANLAASDGDIAARIHWVMDRISDTYGGLPAFQSWAHDHGLPRLSALGVTADMHSQICRDVPDASSYKANPVALSPTALNAILEQA